MTQNTSVDTTKIDTPTVQSGQGWLICNSSLGCGSKVLQGWSSGIGIAPSNKTEFEKKMFKLLYLSLHPEHCSNAWKYKALGRSVEAPISVSMGRHQFMAKGSTYTFSSTCDWIERLVTFVKKYDLGEISVGHKWNNPHYTGAANQTGTWTWNGKCPKAADVGLTDWSLPE